MNKLSANDKVRFCLVLNVISLLFVIILICIFKDNSSKYFRLGPSDNLTVISVNIDTWFKWGIVVITLCIFGIADVIIHELGSPVLGFNVYNPDKKIITEFTKNELNFLSNAMFMVSAIREVFNTVVSITQLDLALVTVIVKELASIVTIRLLLNEKKFIPKAANLKLMSSKVMPIA
jgi:hypothetical protein